VFEVPTSSLCRQVPPTSAVWRPLGFPRCPCLRSPVPAGWLGPGPCSPHCLLCPCWPRIRQTTDFPAIRVTFVRFCGGVRQTCAGCCVLVLVLATYTSLRSSGSSDVLTTRPRTAHSTYRMPHAPPPPHTRHTYCLLTVRRTGARLRAPVVAIFFPLRVIGTKQ
jgi:hypothetical protein